MDQSLDVVVKPCESIPGWREMAAQVDSLDGRNPTFEEQMLATSQGQWNVGYVGGGACCHLENYFILFSQMVFLHNHQGHKPNLCCS